MVQDLNLIILYREFNVARKILVIDLRHKISVIGVVNVYIEQMQIGYVNLHFI